MASLEDPSKFIKQLYSAFLNREPEQESLEYLVWLLNEGGDVYEIFDKIYNSEEAINLRKSSKPEPFEPGHFYSPIVNLKEAKVHLEKAFSDLKSKKIIPEIDLTPEKILETWELLREYLREAPFPEEPSKDYLYHYDNPAFTYLDGAVLYAMIRHFHPRRIIEIGSGWSSACMVDTVENYLNNKTEMTFIEPHPKLLKKTLGEKLNNYNLIHSKVQDVNLEVFSNLEKNDILFIDSSHVLKTGSDVCFELFEILPVLKPGVVIHFHDIFWPFEYPKVWVLEDKRSWNEVQALRAFLSNNKDYEVLFFCEYFYLFFKDKIIEAKECLTKNPGGSFWMKKIK